MRLLSAEVQQGGKYRSLAFSQRPERWEHLEFLHRMFKVQGLACLYNID